MDDKTAKIAKNGKTKHAQVIRTASETLVRKLNINIIGEKVY
jgi:hypothetical protein